MREIYRKERVTCVRERGREGETEKGRESTYDILGERTPVNMTSRLDQLARVV